MTLQKYYNKGGYLADHKDFFKNANLKKESQFLVKALGLKKESSILDVACGNGRHLQVLIDMGYRVDGVDYADLLLEIAKMNSVKSKYQPNLIRSRLEKFKANKKYEYAYWFFADLADVRLSKALLALNGVMKMGGKLLIDTDSIFRLARYMSTYKKKDLVFDPASLKLRDKKNKVTVKYLTVPEWKVLLSQFGFELEKVIGDYNGGEYTINSPRLITVAKKNAQAK